MPGYRTCYNLAETPVGPFGTTAGGGGGSPIFDLLPLRSTQIKPTDVPLISSLITRFHELPMNSQLRSQAALHRLAQAKGRLNYGDVALDLGIALEMLLLNAEHEGQELPGQLTLHFRLRGSWLIAETSEERRSIFKTLGNIYSLRSQIAHNGFSEKLDKMEHAKREAMLTEHIAVGERIVQRLILQGIPNDWTAIVLGDKKPQA